MRAIFARKLSFFPFFLTLVASNAESQQPPKTDRTGNPICIVRNDSTTPVVIEYRNNNQWQEVKLEPAKDANIVGDRIRVSTTREDKAVVTVDLPVQPGKKYRLVWNKQASIWDFSVTS